MKKMELSMKDKKKYVGAEFYVYHNWNSEIFRLKGLSLHSNEDRFLFETNILQETFVVEKRLTAQLYECSSSWGRTFVATKSWIDKECMRIDDLQNKSFKIVRDSRVANGFPTLKYKNERVLAVGEIVTLVGHENYHFKLLTLNGSFEWYPINSFVDELNDNLELL